MSKKIIYIENTFISGVLFIKEVEATGSLSRNRQGLFQCSCGNKWIASISSIKSRKNASCGCRKGRYKHGDTQKESIFYPLYKTWEAIKQRCHNPKYKFYFNYGGRGIEMYKPWREDYLVFKKDVLNIIGNKPGKEYQIDRIDNNKGYIPNNIRWENKHKPFLNKRNSVLSKEDVLEIKWLLSLKQYKKVKIAKDYNCSCQLINDIETKRAHKYILLNK